MRSRAEEMRSRAEEMRSRAEEMRPSKEETHHSKGETRLNKVEAADNRAEILPRNLVETHHLQQATLLRLGQRHHKRMQYIDPNAWMHRGYLAQTSRPWQTSGPGGMTSGAMSRLSD